LAAETRAGSKVVLQVLRKKKTVDVTVTVAEAPDEGFRRPAGPSPKS
jgi:S1-C subfamily serine protease